MVNLKTASAIAASLLTLTTVYWHRSVSQHRWFKHLDNLPQPTLNLNGRLDGEPLNVLFNMQVDGSHFKNQAELAEFMADLTDSTGNNLYNITCMVWRDEDRIRERDNLHFYRLGADQPVDMKALSLTRDFVELLDKVQPMNDYMFNMLTDEGRSELDQLKEMDFDLMMVDFNNFQHKQAEYLEIPYMYQFFYMPEFSFQTTMSTPTQQAYTVNFGLDSFEYVDKWGFNNIVDKTKEMILHFMVPYLVFDFNDIINRLPESMQDNWIHLPSRGVMFGLGIEGLRDQIQVTQNIEVFYPADPSDSKFNEEFLKTELDQEYKDFFARYEEVILVSFGTTFVPPDEQMDLIVDMIKHVDSSRVGVIISLKDYSPSYPKILEMNLPNVLLKPRVPQREILNHEKTKVFLTHCGANGVIESLYYGVAMYGFPVMFEQKGVCNKLEMMGVAHCYREGTTAKDLAEVIQHMGDPASPEMVKMDWVRRVMEFEELRSGVNAPRLVDYYAKFGTQHLTVPQHALPIWLKNDLDILAMIAVTCIWVALFMRQVAKFTSVLLKKHLA